jgi:glycosyltransferase involved in cell wall biosynthesis
VAGEMKIAILTTDNREYYQDYGAARPYFGMAPEALLEGLGSLPDIEIHVISCLRRTTDSPNQLRPNVHFHPLTVPKLGWMTTAYQGCIRTIRKRLQQIQPAIVHGQGTERECAISAVASGFPNVITIHGNMAELTRLFRMPIGSYNWLAAKLESFTLKRTAGVFCNSEYTERLVKPRTRRTWRVPNAIREAFFVPSAVSAHRDRPILVNVGVISPRKRQLELLGVISELQSIGLNFEFHFIGHADRSAPYAAKFFEKLKPLESKGVARHLGPKSTAELIDCFDASSAMVHFPSEEAFGLVVAEALARDLRFFGTRTGGIIDISSGVSGAELCDVEDWQGLTSALTEWIRAGSPRAAGAAELMRARYHPHVVARRHIEIYREVLKLPS